MQIYLYSRDKINVKLYWGSVETFSICDIGGMISLLLLTYITQIKEDGQNPYILMVPTLYFTKLTMDLGRLWLAYTELQVDS